MVDATTEVMDRGGLACDRDYPLEGTTLGTHDEPNPDTDHAESTGWGLVVECPEATVHRETGTHEGAHGGHWPGVYTRRAREHGLAGDLVDAGHDRDDVDAVFRTARELERRPDAEVDADRDPGRFAAVRSGWT